MRVHIAQVAGVTDLYTLILTFFLGHAAIMFPLMYEKMNAKNRADGYVQDTSPFWMGFLCHAASWAVVFAYFASGSTEEGRSLAIALVLTLFILELTFPAAFVLQWGKVGPFKDYMIGEFTFCLLSFTTKTFLAWATLIGANAYARRG
jgi:ABC-type spermidine/putrescine transport system permease subunit I